MMNVDFSIRGWNRRPKNSKFLAWNGGDAVGQIFVNSIKNKKSSFGFSFGLRSLYEGNIRGGLLLLVKVNQWVLDGIIN